MRAATTIRTSERGFSLVEILVSLAVVSISVLVLVNSNAQALKMTREAERMSQATLLAEDLMNRALVVTDTYGFGENDVWDRGDFEQVFPGEYPKWTWEYSLAKTKIRLPDLSQFMGDTGVDDGQQQQAMSGTLAGLVDPAMMEEMVGNYIREVRVKVCYPTGQDTSDCVELVSHVVNPGGQVMGSEDQQVLLDRMGSGNMPDILEEDQ